MEQKTYVRYTGYPGGQRFTSAEEMMKKDSLRMLEKAVKGMLPKTKLGREVFRNMHLYTGTEHKHQAQQPVAFNINQYN